jgi:Bacterial type II/III secretion system short domain
MMHKNRLALIALVTCGLAVCAQVQESKTKTSDVTKNAAPPAVSEPKSLQVFQLAYSNAAETARVISEVFYKSSTRRGDGSVSYSADPSQARVTADHKSNSLVVYGTQSDMDEIRKLLAQLDRPASSPKVDDVLRPRIFRLKNTPDNALEASLKLLQDNGSGGVFSIDTLRHQVMILANEQQADIMQAYIAKWDESSIAAATSNDVQVRIIWFTNYDGRDPENQSRYAMPDEFKQLLPTLNRVGLNNKPFPAATYSLTAKPNTPFSTIGDMFSPVGTIKIAGQYDDRKTPAVLSLSIRDVDDGATNFDIKTELSAPLGHLIVLGATRVGFQQMAFVVQVTRAESVNALTKP